MNRHIRVFRWLSLLVIPAMIVAACQTAAPESQIIERTVVVEETVVVEVEVEVEGETVIVTATPEPEQAAPEEDVLVITTNQDPSTLDPASSSDTQSLIYTLGMYEALTRWKPDALELEPWLAESWEISEDGLTYTFALREDVVFHDGTPFNAEAAKFSIDRMKAVDQGRAFVLEKVVSVEVLDDYTLQMTLSELDASFFLGLPNVLMVSPTSFGPHMRSDNATGWAYDNASGTGPFKFLGWETGIRVELEKFDDYWGGWDHPHVNRIIALVIGEPGTRRLMLESGDVDVVLKMEDQIDDAIALQDDPDLAIDTFPTLSITYIVLANHKGPTADVRVRQAISYAFDYDAMIEIAFGGVAAQAQGPLNSSILFHDPGVFQYTRDLDKANELLEEAGFPGGGFDLTFGFVGSSGVQGRTAEILQASLADVGINVIAEGQTWPTLFAAFQDPDTAPDMFNLNNHSAFPDPDFTFSRFFTIAAQGTGGFNGGYYTNEEADELMRQARVETDPDVRADMYQRIQEIMVDEAVVIFNAEMVYMQGRQNYVQGIQYIPAFSRTLGYLNTIYLDK